MIVKVYQYAFGQGEVREVELVGSNLYRIESGKEPENLREEADKILKAVLEGVFYWGQNEHQPQDKYSVSMGDVAELWGKHYLCRSGGWKEMSEEELEAWKRLDVSQRQLSLLCQH